MSVYFVVDIIWDFEVYNKENRVFNVGLFRVKKNVYIYLYDCMCNFYGFFI